MVYDVYCFMKKDAAKQNCIMTKNQIMARTSEATQISVSTIRRILQEAKTSDIFKTPGTVRKRTKPITDLAQSDKEIVKQCIRNFQKSNEESSIGKLLSKLQSDINFKGSEASLRRILKGLGFKWNKNKKCLLELSTKPVPVIVEIDPCYEGATIKKEVEEHILPDCANYEGVRIKKENGVYPNDSFEFENHEISPISYDGVTFKKDIEDYGNTNTDSYT
ncbi:jg4036 [Pararge aegeria aegeria]|uniref:Jg4036 protein n=1 Tax=Pararge aegeria aegeria TaxID=348720 RepID=A0A8S4R854_9NEOP|nr:jg4036 [Pararge aegeria aegeria]